MPFPKEFGVRYFSGERYGFAMSRRIENYRCYDQRNLIDAGDNIDIVVHHAGYVGYQEKHTTTGVALLEHRATNLVRYIRESPDLALGRVEQCLCRAFERLDLELEAMVRSQGCSMMTLDARPLWMTRYNSLVVIVDRNHGRVHVAGSGQVQGLLVKAPGSRDNSLLITDEVHNAVAEYRRQHHYPRIGVDVLAKATQWIEDEEADRYRVQRKIDEHDKLFFYKHVELHPAHEHVMLASPRYVNYPLLFRVSIGEAVRLRLANLSAYFSPVVMGFKEAICQVLNECPQSGRTSLLLVLCLDRHSHSSERKSRNAAGNEGSNKYQKLNVEDEGVCSATPPRVSWFGTRISSFNI